MTAAEVIEQIKTLAPQEQVKVLDHLRATTAVQADAFMDAEKFDRAAEWVLTHHADLLRKLAQ